jgi:protein involved in temperature-dependent protein secretion
MAKQIYTADEANREFVLALQCVLGQWAKEKSQCKGG